MKSYFYNFIMVATFLFSAQALAEFQAYKVAPCSFWKPDQDGGFVCQNIPATILVPKAESIGSVLHDQSRRIEELERKLTELEASCKKP